MVQCADDTGLRADADAQVDIANLGGGGICQHSEDVIFLDGTDGTENHAAQAKKEQYILHSAAVEHVRTEAAENHLQQEEDVALGHETGQNAGGAGGGIAVGVRHPIVEGEKAALDGQTHGNQADGGAQGNVVLAAFIEGGHAVMEAGQQQMTGDVIQDGYTQQEQTGANQAENHIAHGGQGGSAQLTNHQQAASGQRADFNEHIAGENIVGVAQHQQGGLNQVSHDEVEMTLVFGQIQLEANLAAHEAQEHHQGKDGRKQALQNAHADFVAPGVGEVSHDISDRLTQLQHHLQHQERADAAPGAQRHGQIPGSLAV